MEYVILDLEFNGVYSNKLNGYFNEIIDIGAVKVDENMRIIDEFSVLIKPMLSQKINKHVENLTKLTAEELQSNGIPFIEAIKLFKEFLLDSTLVTWSDSDIKVIFENYKYFLGKDGILFIKSFLDLQKYCEKVMSIDTALNNRLSLSCALKLLGINSNEDKEHQALYDSILAYKCFDRLYDKELVDSFTKKCIYPEFYDRINFKNSLILDLNKINIDISNIDFYCETCKVKAKPLSSWKRKSKSFCADFQCPICHEKFRGKLKFVKTYDGVKVNKSQSKLDEEADKE